jgi:hypothetical protein
MGRSDGVTCLVVEILFREEIIERVEVLLGCNLTNPWMVEDDEVVLLGELAQRLVCEFLEGTNIPIDVGREEVGMLGVEFL